MPIEILTALISFAGVLAAAAISWGISKRQVTSEIKKLRFEVQQVHALELQKSRLAVYPRLYTLLESISKRVQARDLDHSNFSELVSQIDAWYTENGLILTADTNRRLYSVLRRFRNIAGRAPESFTERLYDDEKRRRLINYTWLVTIGLRADIGVFGVEFFDPDFRPKSYQEVDEVLEELKPERDEV